LKQPHSFNQTHPKTAPTPKHHILAPISDCITSFIMHNIRLFALLVNFGAKHCKSPYVCFHIHGLTGDGENNNILNIKYRGYSEVTR